MTSQTSTTETQSLDKFLVQNARVLMIDDEPILIELVRAFLEEAGYEAFEGLSDPAKALGSIRKQTPDVILLDLMMPEVSGFDILEQVRADESMGHVPVIVMTSASDADTKLRVLELGATDFLEKPVDPSELVLRLRNTLAFKAQNDRMKFFDPLTSLPNRKLFMSQLLSTVRRTIASKKTSALLHISLDRFDKVNETLGHRAGDQLLRAAARRLQDALRGGDTAVRGDEMPQGWSLSRTGGNEFMALMPALASTHEPFMVARRMLKALEEPFDIDGREIYTSGSIGVSACPLNATDADALLQRAQTAHSAARSRGRSQYAFYSKELDAENRQRLTLEGDLRKAIGADEFELHYQPKIDLTSGRIVGAEALLRWNHPTRGRVPPLEFIPVAEELGLMTELAEVILEQACTQAARWRRADMNDLCVAVNMSATQFGDDRLLKQVEHAIRMARIDPAMLTLELTESVLMHDTEAALARLEAIKEIGVRTSLDDFGTGFSSLAYLRRMRIDELKIDKSFIDPLPEQSDSAAIVRAILAMSHSLGMDVVAEGVERVEQLAFLREAGCDVFQGFLRSKPVPADTFFEMVTKERTAPDPAATAPPRHTVPAGQIV